MATQNYNGSYCWDNPVLYWCVVPLVAGVCAERRWRHHLVHGVVFHPVRSLPWCCAAGWHRHGGTPSLWSGCGQYPVGSCDVEGTLYNWQLFTHSSLVMLCVSGHLSQYCFKEWLGALQTPSLYLNQCWLIIQGVLWHSPKSNFSCAHKLNPWDIFGNYTLKVTITSKKVTVFRCIPSWCR